MFKNYAYLTSLLILLLISISTADAGTACKPVDLSFAPSYNAGTTVVSYANADLNGDGKMDIATSNPDRTFSVLFGDGAGGFAPPIAYTTDYNIWRGITAADINADNKPDIVLGAWNFNQLKIYINDGSGGFNAPPITYTSPVGSPNQGEWYDLKSGDFNGDGKADIVAMQYQSGKKLKVFLNNGAGGIALAQTIDLSASFNAGLVVGNINNDSMADIAVWWGNPGLWSVGWILGTSGGLSLTPGFTMTGAPIAITLADFNNDSATDMGIAFGENNEQHLAAWLNLGGVFTRQPGANLTYVLHPVDITSGDFNGDGKQDIAAMIDNGLIATEYGVGNGTFQNERLWTVPEGSFVFSADLNQDSRSDLVTIGRSFNTAMVSVLKNTHFTGFTAPEPIFYGEKLITAGDLNGDALLDVVTSPTGGGSGNYIAYALNNNARSFLPALTVDGGPDNIKALRTGDFNGDGKLDVVSAHGNNNRMIEVYLGNGTGTLATGIPTSLNIISNDAVVSDFNGDGKDDLFVVSESGQGYSLLNTGTGTFTVAPNFPITLQSDGALVSLQKGDFNSDGKMDIVVNGSQNSNGTVSIYAGAGNGQFSLLAANVAPLMKAVVADLNGDGKLDLAGFASGIFPANGVTGVLGNGAGGFGQPFTREVTGTIEVRSVVSGDFNLDGLDDVAFAMGINEDGPGLVVVPSMATGPTPSWDAPLTYSFGMTPTNIVAADFDHDGKKDIGFTNFVSRGVFYNNSGTKPCLSINDAIVTEGNSGIVNASFTVNLSASSAQAVRVNYTLEMENATRGDDLESVSGRLEIPAGQTSATINVPVKGDLLDEFDETFKINLSSPDGASLTDATALGTIVDNDAEPTLTITDVTRTETGSPFQPFVFTVNTSAPSGKNISFRYTTANGTAVAPGDYGEANSTWTLAPGATSTTISIFVGSDSTYEPDETFFLNITEPANVTLADGQGQGTILNDDSVPTLNAFGGGVVEGDTGGSNTVQHQFSLSNPTYLPVTISYASANGTATAGSDYVALNGSVVIPAEQQFVSINVQSVGDTINEPNETFSINLNVTNVASQPAPVNVTVFDDERISNDYDNDGKTDLVVFRPGDQIWYTLFSSTNSFTGIRHGLATDVLVAGDYNADGRFDISVWRPETGTWFPRVTPSRTQQWGQNGDIPVPGDYDNDGRIDLAVFRPSDHTWYIQLSSNGSYMFVPFGLAEDKPVQADYDGDGKTDIAVFRPGTGTWYILRSSDNGFVGLNWGLSTDRPLPADYDGDGKADIAVYRDGDWYVNRSSDNGFTAFHWGQAGDKPVPGNYDGDAKTDFAVYRDGTWWIFRSETQDFVGIPFGLPDDTPVPFVNY